MRLRHKKGAEEDVKKSEFIINEFKNKYFDNDNNRLEIEIGMGKGQFIIEKAKRNPNINYIGIEKSATILLKALEKHDKEKLDKEKFKNENTAINNLLFLCIPVEKVLDYIKMNSVSTIYLNFSDPWPKARHEIRRLTYKNYLMLYKKLLIKNGIIELKTDNIDFFNYSIDSINSNNSILPFEIIYKTYDLHSDTKEMENNIMTEYEKKWSEKGKKIGKLVAVST